MTEVVRSSFGKRYVKQYAKQIRCAMAEEHQWGLSVPGACESLCHWRGTVEDMARAGEIQPVVIADLDQVNMFGNAEWDSIRQSIDSNLSEIMGWTTWTHMKPSEVVLPSGECIEMDRGAAQGDAFGSYQAASTQAQSRRMWSRESDGSLRKGACDEWYIDDGQLVIQPSLLDPWLRAFDKAISTYGATRGTVAEGNAKSSCRLYCLSGSENSIEGWCTEYVKATMRVLDASETTVAIGAPFGGGATRS